MSGQKAFKNDYIVRAVLNEGFIQASVFRGRLQGMIDFCQAN